MLLLPSIPLTNILQHTWIDPLGAVHSLTREDSPNVFVSAGAAGLGTTTFDLDDAKLPFGAGTFVRHINTRERTIELPIVVRAANFNDLILAVENLHDWFATGDEQNKTPGYLRITRNDGSIRQLACYYTEGLDQPDESGPTFAKYAVKLYAPDPYPTDQSDTILTYPSVGILAGGFDVINHGRLVAFPRWKITGPFSSNISLGNVTRGESMVITHTLTVGHYMVIDTRPSELIPGFSVYDDLGNNLIGRIEPTSVFWPLSSGLNGLGMVFAGGTTAATTVELTYLARYRSLYR